MISWCILAHFHKTSLKSDNPFPGRSSAALPVASFVKGMVATGNFFYVCLITYILKKFMPGTFDRIFIAVCADSYVIHYL